jgi:hypothetical protein
MIISDILTFYKSYLTIWIITIVILHNYDWFQDYHFALLILVNTALFGGCFITYIYPGHLEIPMFGGMIIEGSLLRILDFLTHILPNVHTQYRIFASHCVQYSNQDALFLTLIFCLYLSLNHPYDRYKLSLPFSIFIVFLSIVFSLVSVFVQHYLFPNCSFSNQTCQTVNTNRLLD